MAEDIVRVAATAGRNVTEKSVKVLAYVANKKGNIFIPSDIKTKNNLNPNIQGFVGNNLYPDNVFTFKKTGSYKDYNKINVFPKNSEKMLWGDMSVTENNGGDRYRGVLSSYSSDNPKSSLDYSSFLYDLPQIQIREYLPDLPMDQWLNVFGETFKQMERVFRTVKDRDDVTVGGILSSLCEDALNGTIVLNLLEKLGDKRRLPRYTKTNNMKDALLYDFPRILYRELMSYQVTNWYVLPYSGKIDFGSRGQNGWQPRDLSNRFQFITNTLKNVNINIRPLWKMTSQDGDSIDFELTLFNDTIDSAVQNFKFVHTIIPNNMWTQYGIMQHNSSLYDVQFSGGLRYFCCALDVQCEQIGKSRIPPPGFIERVVFSPQQPKLDVAKESKANLEKELADSEKSIKEVETQIRSLREELTELDTKSKLPEYFFEEEEINEKKNEVQGKIGQLETEKSALYDRKRQLESQVRQANYDLDSIKDKIALDVYGNIRNDKPGYIEAFRIPDMFKITFRFKSLIPSNFNTYMMSFAETPVLIDTPENEGHFDTIYQDLGTSLAGIVLDRIEKAMGGTKENPSEEQKTGTGSSRENPEGGQ